MCCFADEAGIQFQMLNRSKGAAVWVSVPASLCVPLLICSQSPRAQIDRKLYKKHMQAALHNCPNLDILAGSVFDLVLSNPSVTTDLPLSEIRGVKLGWICQTDFN